MDSTQLFLDHLVQKHAQRHQNALRIEIADASGLIIADSEGSRVGTKCVTSLYAIDTRQPMILGEPTAENEGAMRYFVPVMLGKSVWGVVIVWGRLDLIRSCGETINDAIESFLLYEQSLRQSDASPQRRIVTSLISGSADENFILHNVGTAHYGDDNIYAVILIKMELSSMEYFSINLDLGYQSTFEVLQTSLLEVVKNNKYITGRDIYAFIDENSIVIIKSFLRIKDVSKIYLALDRVCHSILEDLNDHAVFKFYISYGNTCASLFDVHRSYKDAAAIMDMSTGLYPGESFFTLENILFESVCESLHPQIVNKMLTPLLEILRSEASDLTDDLLDLAEKYVDHCMRIRPTAQSVFLHRNTVDAKLSRFKAVTGLDPSQSFRDAFLAKMLAIHSRSRKPEQRS